VREVVNGLMLVLSTGCHRPPSQSSKPALGLDPRDRDGGILLLASLFGLYPFLRKIFADAGYQGPV
jgi:hypothetical protein